MKKRTKALLMALCALMLCAASVLGTIAYLTASAKVTNTFSVGNVAITMDEAKVNEYGVVVEGGGRVTKNEYILVPGHTYTKDPTVHVAANSEDCYVFVKIEAPIGGIETAEKTIQAQITGNGWALVSGEYNVYYKVVNKNDTNRDLVVFESFTIRGNVTKETLTEQAGLEITVTAYAIQLDGFENNVAGAWAEVSKLDDNTTTP